MHWELLLLIVLIWWFTSCCPSQEQQDQQDRQVQEWEVKRKPSIIMNKDDEMIMKRIQEQLDRLLRLAQQDAPIYRLTTAAQRCRYRLFPHPERTFVVNKQSIYLLIDDQ